MNTEHAPEVQASIEARLSANEVLAASEEFRSHLSITADPVREPDLFHQQEKEANPRFNGERHVLRQALEADQTQWSTETKEIIMQTAERERMLKHETPLEGHHDAVIVLAGRAGAARDRLEHVLEQIKNGNATVGQIIVAGSSRKLKEDEQVAVAGYAPNRQTEFQLCVSAAMAAQQENPGLLITPVFVDKERASTPDVLEASLQALQNSNALPKRGAKIAAVTHQIYEASTTLDLERVAKSFSITKTFVAGRSSDPEIVKKRTPATYIAEIIRTDRAAVNSIQAERARRGFRAQKALGGVAAGEFEVGIIERREDGSWVEQTANGAQYVYKPKGGSWLLRSASGVMYKEEDHLQ